MAECVRTFFRKKIEDRCEINKYTQPKVVLKLNRNHAKSRYGIFSDAGVSLENIHRLSAYKIMPNVYSCDYEDVTKQEKKTGKKYSFKADLFTKKKQKKCKKVAEDNPSSRVNMP